YLSPGRRLDRLAKLVDGVGIGNEQLDRLHDAFGVEIELRLIERHIDDRCVVFGHTDLEDGGNRVALHARVYTERRDVALGGDKRDLAAGAEAEGLGHARADGDAPRGKTHQVAVLDVIGNRLHLGEIV